MFRVFALFRARAGVCGIFATAGAPTRAYKNVEERSVRRNLKIEIKKTVNENSDHAQRAGQSDSAAHFRIPLTDFFPNLPVENDQEPNHDSEADDSHLA
jgi:thiamine phosphate synthase YjbQ (UPF0047 family)